MPDTKKEKTEKDLDKLVDNVGKVYTKWIRKGIIGHDSCKTGPRSDHDSIEESESSNIELSQNTQEQEEESN